MAEAKTNGGLEIEGQGAARPYAPSWIDLLAGRVVRWPGPSWLYYGSVGVLILSIQAGLLWAEGASPLDGLGLSQVYLVAAAAYLLSLIHYLDERAGVALEAMRPALQAGEAELRRLRYRLTTLPALPAMLASLVALAFVILSEAAGEPYRLKSLETFPISAYALRTVYLICWMFFGAFLYHTLHQLRVINHIFTSHARVDLFRVQPLYALSNLAALTAGSLAIVSYGWLLVNPWIDRADPLVLLPMGFLLLCAAVTFVWPQIGVHRLQVAEKERLEDEAIQRFKVAVGELHRKIDAQELDGIMDLNMAMASLEMELKAIRKAPTWPWDPDVVRLLVTALALPLGLWLVELILQRTLGL